MGYGSDMKAEVFCGWFIVVPCLVALVPCLMHWGTLGGFIRWSVVANPLFALGYVIQCMARNRRG